MPRGRPKGSKNKPKQTEQKPEISETVTEVKPMEPILSVSDNVEDFIRK